MDKQKWSQRYFTHGSIRFGRNAQQRETQKKTYEYKNIYWFWYEFLKRSDAYRFSYDVNHNVVFPTIFVK